MVTAIIGLGFTLFGMVIGGVVWGIRLEGQVKTQKELSVQQEAFMDERQAATITRFDRTDDKLDALSVELDRALEVIHRA